MKFFQGTPISLPTYSPAQQDQIADGLRTVQRRFANRTPERTLPSWDRLPIPDQFLGKITTTPPDWAPKQSDGSSAKDYADARYWVKRCVPDSTNATYSPEGVGTSNLQRINDPSAIVTAAIVPYIVTATNLAELPPDYLGDGTDVSQGCHLLKDGAIVEVTGHVDPTSSTKIWYCFSRPYPNQFVVAGNDPRPGVYTINLLIPATSLFVHSGSSAVAESDLGTSGTVQHVFVNSSEWSKDPADPTQHDLSMGQQVTGTYWMDDDSSPARHVFIGTALNVGNCS